MGKLEKFGRSILKKLNRKRRDDVANHQSSATSTSSSSSDEDSITVTRGNQENFIHRIQLTPSDENQIHQMTSSPSEDRMGSPAASDEGSAGYATDDTVMSSLSPLDIKRVSVDYSESQGYYSNAELSPIPRIEVTVPPPADLSHTVPAHLSPRSRNQEAPAHQSPSSRSYEVTVPPAHQSLRSHDLQKVTVDPAHQSQISRNLEITVPLADLRGTVEAPAHLSPRSRTYEVTVPPAHLSQISRNQEITVEPVHLKDTVPAHQTSRTPIYKKLSSQEYPRIDVRNRLLKKHEPIYKSSQLLAENTENKENLAGKFERSATLSNLTSSEEEDPIERFMKSHIYKTKMITTVFEAKDRGFEEISADVIHEIDRWFESKNMMAVACELHWSVPRGKRSRQLECRLKEKLLQALRENNKRLLYLRGMGHGKTPVKLAESKTVENISRDRETDSVRGIYQRSYTRLLPYLHKETPEWHSQYWTLQDIKNSEDVTSPEYPIQAEPQKFLFDTEPADVLSKNALISLNIIGLSILGNSRKSCGSLFLQ